MFTAIRLRSPGFKLQPGQKFENENFCFRRTPVVVKACHPCSVRPIKTPLYKTFIPILYLFHPSILRSSYSFIYSIIYPKHFPFAHLSNHSSIHPSIHPSIPTHSAHPTNTTNPPNTPTDILLHPSIHPSIYPSIHPSNNTNPPNTPNDIPSLTHTLPPSIHSTIKTIQETCECIPGTRQFVAREPGQRDSFLDSADLMARKEEQDPLALPTLNTWIQVKKPGFVKKTKSREDKSRDSKPREGKSRQGNQEKVLCW